MDNLNLVLNKTIELDTLAENNDPLAFQVANQVHQQCKAAIPNKMHGQVIIGAIFLDLIGIQFQNIATIPILHESPIDAKHVCHA